MSPRTELVNQQIRDARREQILQSALHVFAAKGLSATKIADIASAARISQGLIHHYFSSKEHVYAAVAERAMLGAMGTLAQPTDSQTSPWDQLVAMYESMLAGIADEPEYLLVVIQCLISEDTPSDIQAMLSKHGNQFFLSLIGVIRDGQAAGQVIDGEPEELALLLMATIQGIVLTQFTRRLFTGDAHRRLPRAAEILRLLKKE